MYLQVTLPALSNGERWCPRVGLALLKNVEIEIGGQRIDRHYGDWINIWNELSLPLGRKQGWQRMVGQSVTGEHPNGYLNGNYGSPETVLTIPLEFWFNRNYGLALPLIALQYHEVKLNIELRSLAELSHWDKPINSEKHIVNASLWVDYIYLDTDERRRFAQVSHEYLIEQVQVHEQSISVGHTQSKIDLSFNHPVKELVWVIQYDGMINGNGDFDNGSNGEAFRIYKNLWFNYSDRFEDSFYGPNFLAAGNNDIPALKNNCTSAKLQLNGHDRFAERNGDYFNSVQPFQHHENAPQSRGINVYSFALKPEDIQPSGTCNFSRIDTAVLTLGHANLGNRAAKARIYAINYNVLRITSGMAGLAYSN
jgi:hypothetical protein